MVSRIRQSFAAFVFQFRLRRNVILFKFLLWIAQHIFDQVMIGVHAQHPEQIGWVMVSYEGALPEMVPMDPNAKPVPEPPFQAGDTGGMI